MHQKYSKVAINECGSHIYRAMADWIVSKDCVEDAKEVKKYGSQFVTTMKIFAKRLVKECDLAMGFSTLAYFNHIVCTRYIPCANYDLNSEIQADYDDNQAENIAKTWAQIICAKAKECQIVSDTLMDKQISEALADRQFGGRKIIDKIARGMKNTRQTVAVTYLSKKDTGKSKGEISVVVMHSPFADDGSVAPQMLDKFTVPVKLPFTKGKVKNSMLSRRTSDYLVNYWGRKLSLVVATGPNLVGKANNIDNPSTNQQAEGMMNSEKNHDPDTKKDACDPGAYMWHRYKRLNESSKNVVTEMENLDEKLDKREELKQRRDKRKAKSEENDLSKNSKKPKRARENDKTKTKDEEEMEIEDNTDMVHDRNQGWNEDDKNIKMDLL